VAKSIGQLNLPPAEVHKVAGPVTGSNKVAGLHPAEIEEAAKRRAGAALEGARIEAGYTVKQMCGFMSPDRDRPLTKYQFSKFVSGELAIPTWRVDLCPPTFQEAYNRIRADMHDLRRHLVVQTMDTLLTLMSISGPRRVVSDEVRREMSA
jgi:hypothetical protein